jgi:hypothetical protein
LEKYGEGIFDIFAWVRQSWIIETRKIKAADLLFPWYVDIDFVFLANIHNISMDDFLHQWLNICNLKKEFQFFYFFLLLLL